MTCRTQKMKKTFLELDRDTKETGLPINKNRTNYTAMFRKIIWDWQALEIEGMYKVEIVQKFE